MESDLKIDPTVELTGADLRNAVLACLQAGRILIAVYQNRRMDQRHINTPEIESSLRSGLRTTESCDVGKWRYRATKRGVVVIFTFDVNEEGDLLVVVTLEGMAMNCPECKNTMTKSIGDHHYVESGLDNVILQDVTKYECESCGAKHIVILAMSKLHREIARSIAQKPARLVPAEVAFIRDHLDLSNKEFSDLMGVSPEHASRWTSSDQIGVPAERFLRILAIIGPEMIALRRNKPSLNEQFEVDARELVETLGFMPSRDVPTREVSIGIRRSGSSDWTSADSQLSDIDHVVRQ